MRSSCEGVLGLQSFSGSDLIRGMPTRTVFSGTDCSSTGHVRVILVDGRKVFLRNTSRCLWYDQDDLHPLGFDFPRHGDVGTLDLEYLHYKDPNDPSSSTIRLPLYYIGHIKDIPNSQGRVLDEYYVCNINNLDLSARFPSAQFKDLRTLLTSFTVRDVSYAGSAVALAQWHQNHQFCSKCGTATRSISGGAKRQCLQNPLHKHYPRTDPVIISLVVLDAPTPTSDSTNNTRSSNQQIFKEKALVGRSKGLPPGTLTCLSGFIDQGESIEEAVAREVREESGVLVHSVEILGSQPWPIGRGGSCELMIGCIAKTRSETLHIDYSEMEECRWVEKEEVLEALKKSLNPESPFVARGGGQGSAGGEAESVGCAVQEKTSSSSTSVFYVPPPYAIAHHLLKYWAENKIESRGGQHPVPQGNKL